VRWLRKLQSWTTRYGGWMCFCTPSGLKGEKLTEGRRNLRRQRLKIQSVERFCGRDETSSAG